MARHTDQTRLNARGVGSDECTTVNRAECVAFVPIGVMDAYRLVDKIVGFHDGLIVEGSIYSYRFTRFMKYLAIALYRFTL